MIEQVSGGPCPCGSGLRYAACCGLLHAGGRAVTAEALMRSRYVAYVLGDMDYLRATWHPETCPSGLPRDTAVWLGLRILHRDGGQVGDDKGTVEFVAAFLESGKVMGLHEVSRFMRLDGRWFYHKGKPKIEPFGRNDPCPCGSGRKVKQCCGIRGSNA